MINVDHKFARFKEEHTRLHDPTLLRGAVELVPQDLSKFVPSVVRSGTRKTKRKRRHGAAAAWATPKAVRTREIKVEPGEGLLPIGFLKQLIERTPGSGQNTRPTNGDETQTQAPQIAVEPSGVSRTFKLFQEVDFSLDAPATQQVELVWRKEPNVARDHETAGPSDKLQRVLLDHKHGDHFETRIGIADGTYRFGFSVDGHMRGEISFAHQVLLNREGLFTHRTLRRHVQTLWLANNGPLDERIGLVANVPWLIPSSLHVDVPAGRTVQATLILNLTLMKAGLNEGVLHLSVERAKQNVAAAVVHFSVEAEADGAVPVVTFRPAELGELRQGMDQSQVSVEINAHGRGPLSGMINLLHSGALVDFSLNADDAETSSFTHTFQINSGGLSRPKPKQQEARLRLMLLTDSFLANYRFYYMEIPYRLIHLRKSLPALSFGPIRAGDLKIMRLEVGRSDNQVVQLQVNLPAGIEKHLRAHVVRPDVYDFHFHTEGLLPGTNVSETVELIDRNSGLRDQVKVLATVVDGPGVSG